MEALELDQSRNSVLFACREFESHHGGLGTGIAHGMPIRFPYFELNHGGLGTVWPIDYPTAYASLNWTIEVLELKLLLALVIRDNS